MNQIKQLNKKEKLEREEYIRRNFHDIKGDELEYDHYKVGVYAYYDEITDTWWNSCGQKLRDPSEYHADNDGRYY